MSLKKSQWKHFQRGFYPRVAEIELILADDFGLHSPRIYSEWSSCCKRNPNPTPKYRSYVRDGLLNRSVFISYVLEIAFLLLMAASPHGQAACGIAPHIWK